MGVRCLCERPVGHEYHPAACILKVEAGRRGWVRVVSLNAHSDRRACMLSTQFPQELKTHPSDTSRDSRPPRTASPHTHTRLPQREADGPTIDKLHSCENMRKCGKRCELRRTNPRATRWNSTQLDWMGVPHRWDGSRFLASSLVRISELKDWGIEEKRMRVLHALEGTQWLGAWRIDESDRIPRRNFSLHNLREKMMLPAHWNPTGNTTVIQTIPIDVHTRTHIHRTRGIKCHYITFFCVALVGTKPGCWKLGAGTYSGNLRRRQTTSKQKPLASLVRCVSDSERSDITDVTVKLHIIRSYKQGSYAGSGW